MVNTSSSLALSLYGTSQPPEVLQHAQVHELSFLLEGAQVRRLCIKEHEVMRSAGMVIRDSVWGTHSLVQLRSETDAQEHSWSRHVEGVVAEEGSQAALEWTLDIEVDREGLRLKTELKAHRDFLTCRAGLMLLHPLDGVVGAPVAVRHSDGRLENGVFPDRISPGQPFFDIRSLTHSPCPGLTLHWSFSGDTFEMEDQRNWSDASFKTYNRPLAQPCPYTIRAGQSVAQQIEMRLQIGEGHTR